MKNLFDICVVLAGDKLWIQPCVEDKIFERVAERFIEPNSGWKTKPTWPPQVTLQHPLQSTIEVLHGLFHDTSISHFIENAKPFYTSEAKEQKHLYNTAIGGLIFLLAQEMSCVANTALESEKDEIIALKEAHQFDAKRLIPFMSRRPFSDMFADIRDNKFLLKSDVALQKGVEDFVKFFIEAMQFNHYYQKIKVDEFLYRANYAEQFFYKSSGKHIDLIQLFDYFNDDEIKTIDLKGVLAKGIISTAMFRHLKLNEAISAGVIDQKVDDLIKLMRMHNKEYYHEVLTSVQNPRQRLFLDIKNDKSIHISVSEKMISKKYSRKNPIIADLFSPPFPLDEKDAMGFFREGTFENSSYLQEKFGSAIVELRGVWLIKGADRGLRSKSNGYDGFLTDPNCLLEEMSNLYIWLSHLTIDD